jgi:hypothetical protein
MQTVAGGTVAQDGRPFPVLPVAGGAFALLLIIMIVKCSGGGTSEVPEPGSAVAQQPGPVVQQQPANTQVAQPFEPVQTQPTGPSTGAAASTLERALRGRRLWSTVEVQAQRIDVRSATCDDPAMSPTIDTVVPTLRGAGLTRLRCLAQSGSVVFERDL